MDLLDTYPFVDDVFTVAGPGFLAEGGDLYTVFAEAEAIRSAGKVSMLWPPIASHVIY